MTFALHIDKNCTGCNNCVVACPVNALELVVDEPATTKKTYKVQGGKSLTVDEDVCEACGVCLQACPRDCIVLTQG
ncbi:MAG: 4Fe-4S binding protein [Halobacteriota archaeon]